MHNGLKINEIKHVFLSHIHFDHAGAAWAFAEAGAKIYVHPKGLPHLAAPEKLYNSAQMIYGDAMEKLWGKMQPIAAENLHAPAHGEQIEAAGLIFTAWNTPGHAVHHIAWQVENPRSGRRVLFTGDVAGVKIGLHGPVVPPCPPPDIHIEDWLASLELMRNLPVETMFLTHFGKVLDKNAHLDALAERLRKWADWMKPHAEAGTPPAEIVPIFKKMVLEELKSAGVGAMRLKKYNAANPAEMSVAGLIRYWKKKTIVTI